MTEGFVKFPATLLLASAFVALTCAPSGRMSLQQINPSRVYKANVPAFYDEVRLFSIGADFRLERFEQESGRVIGHKNLQVSSTEAGLSSGTTSKRIVMLLKVKAKSATETLVTASFVYGDSQVVLNKSDEAELVSCYTQLFNFLDEKLGPGQIPAGE
jgi:hypothetical protein